MLLPRVQDVVEQELTPQEGTPDAADRQNFQPGLGQVYESPPLDLGQWPVESLAFDPDRPKDIPIAICLEADTTDTEEVCVHFAYMSLQRAVERPDDGLRSPHWSTHIFAQKLQYGGQCFVLHEVFGVNPKSLDVEAESGASDCVICLSAPRDTAVLPCRHMCFCSHCAAIVRLQCDRCPVCRQKVANLLQFRRDLEYGGLPGAKPAAELAAHSEAAPAKVAAPAAVPAPSAAAACATAEAVHPTQAGSSAQETAGMLTGSCEAGSPAKPAG